MVNRRLSRQRALQQREDRRRSANERDAYAPDQFSDEEDEYTTPLSRRSDQHEWHTQRWGYLRDHIGEEWSREEFVESGYVAAHRGRTYDRDTNHVTNRRTPSPDAHTTIEDPPPPDVTVTLGAYGDEPLKVRTGVVAPAGCYIVIDGMSSGRYEAALTFQEWYGF